MQYVQVIFLLFIQVIYVTAPKMAVNDHLLVVYQSTAYYTIVRYQCLTRIHQAVEEMHLILNESEPRSIAIGKRQTASQMYFVTFGTRDKVWPDYGFYMTKVTVDCNNSNQSSQNTVFFDNTTFHQPLSYVFDVSPDGHFAISCTDKSLLIFDLNTLQNFSYKMDWRPDFRPMDVKINGRYVFVAGYNENDLQLRILYLLTLNTSSNTNYSVTFDDEWIWKGDDLGRMPGRFSLSVTSDVTPRILLVVNNPNAVHLLIVNESLQLHYISSSMRLEALDVAWVNQGDKAVVHTRRNDLFVYNMGKDIKFDDSIVPSSQFLIRAQEYPYFMSSEIETAIPSLKNSDFYLHSKRGDVFVLPVSQPGYYSVPNLFLTHGWIFSFIPNSAQCPIRTYKNESGFWSCNRCQPLKNISSISPVSLTCPQCVKKEYCPGELITPFNHFEDVTQNVGYPESPEIDVFDEIILYNMFRADCGVTSPLFLTIMALSVIIFVSIFVFLMKLIKRLKPKRYHLQLFFRHLDLIGQGELWFGGLVTIALLLLAVFASQFSHIYHQQYPIEKQQEQSRPENSCKFHELLNSKFETNLQFLSTPSYEHEQIFYLLDNQPFILHMEFIQAQFHCEHLRLQYTENRVNLPLSCKQNNGVLYVSAPLPVHKMSLYVTLYGNHTTGSVRFGLSAKQLRLNNNTARELNFSKRVNSSHRHRLSQNAHVVLDLTKVINVTEGLTKSDETTISGLWLPTFTFDIDQMFVHIDTVLDSGQGSSTNGQLYSTTLSIYIRETAFFVKNKQKPVARRSEIIFHIILFISVCIDFLAMIFLLLKLWIIPLTNFLLRKLLRPTNWFYRIIFGRDEKDMRQQVYPDVVHLEKEVNTLKIKLQESNDIMQAFIRRVSVNNRSSVDLVSL